jgi:hypothetical protein
MLRACCALAAWIACGANARAEMPRAVVFAPADSGHKSEARAVRDVRESLERLDLAALLAPPPLDLDAMEMTIDCVGESASCLGKLAERAKAQIVIAPSITRKDGKSTLRILYFDARKGDAPRSVERSAKGDELDDATFNAVPDMMRELFGTQPAAKPQPEPEPEAAPQPAPQPQPPPESTSRPLPVGPIVLGAGGVAVLAGGLVLGAIMNSTQDHYAHRSVMTEAQAKQADEERKLGKQEALAADLLIGTGAAALLAATIWFAADMRREERPPAQTALVPAIGPHSAGLALAGFWEVRP